MLGEGHEAIKVVFVDQIEGRSDVLGDRYAKDAQPLLVRVSHFYSEASHDGRCPEVNKQEKYVEYACG